MNKWSNLIFMIPIVRSVDIIKLSVTYARTADFSKICAPNALAVDIIKISTTYALTVSLIYLRRA